MTSASFDFCGIAAGQHADNVTHRAAVRGEMFDVADRCAGQSTRSRLEILVDLACQRVEPPGVDERLHLVAADAEHGNRLALGFRIGGEQCVGSVVRLVCRVNDHEQRARAVLTRQRGLGLQRRLRTGRVPLKRLFGSRSCGSWLKIRTALPVTSIFA